MIEPVMAPLSPTFQATPEPGGGDMHGLIWLIVVVVVIILLIAVVSRR